jgi:uncharacterized damage-inducible protein DinB
VAATTIELGLEANYDRRSPKLIGHVAGLPGCVIKALTEEELVARAPAAVAAYLDWLRAAGEVPPPPWSSVADAAIGRAPPSPPPEVRIKGRVDRAAVREPLLEDDCQPLERAAFEGLLRLLAYSRAAVLDLARSTPELLAADRDWTPGPGQWSASQVLAHVVETEQWFWYELLGHQATEPLLELTRQTTLQLAEEEFARQAAAGPGEAAAGRGQARPIPYQGGWTLRKTLRRCLEHEQEHVAQLRRMIATYQQSRT